jgi:His-Xaa-Ser system radical SAM maturase HxsC
MLLRLSGPALKPLGECSSARFVGRISTAVDIGVESRRTHILRVTSNQSVPPGFRAYLFDTRPTGPVHPDSYVLAPDWSYLTDGDIVRIDSARRSVAALYRRHSASNSLLVTERCDNYCLMCSQPPKEHDDSWLVDELTEVIPLISHETPDIGITGGEPALLGERLVQLLTQLKEALPETAVHVLTNGRRFSDNSFANRIGEVRHPDLMLGIPLYSDLLEEHDYVVQAKGAFEETIRGILNLKRARVRVELRIVIHAETYSRLPELARFVTRNLRFVDHVALMGLELTGFAKTNIDSLWIDPLDYQTQLVEATRALKRAGMWTSIYNHQLCVLPPSLHQFARKSISDWKNFYLVECDQCGQRDVCGGFFASAKIRRSRGIAPFVGQIAPDPNREVSVDGENGGGAI